MSDICIISCGARKVWKSDNSRKLVPAKDAYTGPLFKKCKEYAETASIITTTSGKIHQDILNKVFPESSFQNPVSKLSQGKRLQKLNQLLNDGRKL